MPSTTGTTKIGRNHPCPCGSGKKYKKCCRNAYGRAGFFTEARALSRAMSRDRCSAPPEWNHECTRTYAKAHTVPRASLNRIAANGHVFSFVPNASNLEHHGPKFPPEELGINRASTFTGFCSNHDNAIFAPLEKAAFTGTREQCFLLAYRALARELHLKQSILEFWDARLRKTQPASGLALGLARFTIDAFLAGSRKGYADLASHKADYDQILRSNDYRMVRAHVIELSHPPSVMCSGGIIPEHTFHGEKLIDVLHHRDRCAFLSFSSFADASAGFVAFAWVHDGSNYW